MVDKLNSDQTQVDLNQARNKVNEIIDEVDSITIKSYDAGSLPLVANNGSTVLVTDGTKDNTQCMAYYFQNKWYRHFDNTAIELWAPTEINTKLWLDANDSGSITHSSNVVSQWNDKSGNNNHAIQSSSNKRPTTTSSGMQFDGSNDGFYLTNEISEANLNIFFVLQGHGYVTANDASARILFFDAGSGRKLWVNTSGSTVFNQQNVSGYSDSSTQIHEFSLNSGTLTVRVNGVEALSQGGVTGDMELDRIGLRWDSNTNAPRWTGKMMEILAVPTTTDRAKIEGYLAHKWGLTGNLNGSHPYKTNAPKADSGPGLYIALE